MIEPVDTPHPGGKVFVLTLVKPIDGHCSFHSMSHRERRRQSADNDGCVVRKQTALFIFLPPFFPPSCVINGRCSAFWTAVAKVQPEEEIHFYFPIRSQPSQISRAISVLRTSGVHIWNGSWKKEKKKNSGKLGKPGQIITCLQLEAIWLCSFHTFVPSESQDVQKQIWGSTINMPCASFSDSFHDFMTSSVGVMSAVCSVAPSRGQTYSLWCNN